MNIYITIQSEYGATIFEGKFLSIDSAVDNLYSFTRHNKEYKKEMKKQIKSLPF